MSMYQFSHTLGRNDLTSTNGELLAAPEEDEMGTKWDVRIALNSRCLPIVSRGHIKASKGTALELGDKARRRGLEEGREQRKGRKQRLSLWNHYLTTTVKPEQCARGAKGTSHRTLPFQKGTEVNADIHSQPRCRVDCATPEGTSLPHSSPKAQGPSKKGGQTV